MPRRSADALPAAAVVSAAIAGYRAINSAASASRTARRSPAELNGLSSSPSTTEPYVFPPQLPYLGVSDGLISLIVRARSQEMSVGGLDSESVTGTILCPAPLFTFWGSAQTRKSGNYG